MKIYVAVFYILLEIIILAETCQASNKTIKIFTWWDYITPAVMQKFKNEGFDLEVVEYRSNEVALSKLLNNADYDVVIVSNWVLKVLEQSNKLDENSLKVVRSKRHYYNFIKKLDEKLSCIPYLWATTAYAMDIRKKIKPMNLFELIQLKKNGYKIGIIDDPIEFGAMALLSNDEECAKELSRGQFLEGINKCKFPSANSILEQITSTDFRNSIQSLIGEKTAVYGWHGEVGEVIGKYPFMDFVISSHTPVIGLDSVCILKRKVISTKVINFIARLTDKQMTKLNAEKMQYFSAYEDLNVNYEPKIKKLMQNVIKDFEKKDPIVLYPPSPQAHSILNQWWQKIRYDK